MKHREVAAMSKLKNFTSWKEVNKTITHGKHFHIICQKLNNMIQPSQNLRFILGDFMKMMKLLNADFKHLSILNIRGLNRLFNQRGCAFLFLLSLLGKGRSTFFLLS